MKSLSKLFESTSNEGLHLADYCQFKPRQDVDCSGGLIDFQNDDGSRRALERSVEFEEVFPTYDLSGNRVTPIHSHHRILACDTEFKKPDCAGDCTGCGKTLDTAKCKARQLKCKGSQNGFSFPFMSNPASLIGLFFWQGY
jgi:hypothetical protein